MSSELNLHEISLLDGGVILRKRSVVSADFVDGYGSRESNSFENGFFVVDFADLFIDEIVSPNAELEHFSSHCYLLNEFSQYFCMML